MASSQAQLFEDEYPLIRSCPALNELRLAEEMHDLTLEVKDGGRLLAHKVILAARIPSLRKSNNGSLRKDVSVLRWPSVPLSLATTVIEYAYTGQLQITQSNARAILMFSRMVKLPVLEKWGTEFLLKSVNTKNLPTIWEIAKYFNLGKLMDTCIGQMKAKFESFIYSDMFVSFPAETVLTLLRGDNLAVSSEELVFAAISRWACPCNEVDERRLTLHVPEMLKEIQWQQTTSGFRANLLKSHPIFRRSTDCALLMAEITNWMGAVDKHKYPCPFNQHERSSHTLFVFGKDRNQDKWSVLSFNSQMENEGRVTNMNLREFASFSVVGDSIFVVGGTHSGLGGITTVVEFQVREWRWRQRASLACRRQQHAAAVVWVNAAADMAGCTKALIGVFGGCCKKGNTWTYLASCELYDVAQNRWYKLPELRQRRAGPAAASLPHDDRVFVFGGKDGPATDSVEFCYLRADSQEKACAASTADFWMPAARMRNARANLAAAHFRGRILVAGGEDGNRSNSVEIFTLPDASCPLGQWTELAGMKEARRNFYLVNAGDTVYALGNYYGNHDEPENTVERFSAPDGSVGLGNDFSSWRWSIMSPVKLLEWIRGAASVRIS